MREHVLASVRMLAAMTLLTGAAYPLLVTGMARVAMPERASGSPVRAGDRVVGSRLVGQSFTGDRWFHGRPSATGRVPYDGAASSGSNLGPTNPSLREAVEARAAALRAEDPSAPIPVDLVTASSSGLDPHVSPAAAFRQVRRVARARGLPEDRVRSLVEAHVEGRTLGVLGQPRVNVLLLNLALEDLGAAEPRGR